MTSQSIQAKRGLQLDRVVLLGRTFEEYRRYFLLEPHELIGKKVLDAAGGVSSFCAEANDLGIKVTAFDPIYSLIREKIRERSDPDLDSVYKTIGLVPTYRWAFTKMLSTCGHCENVLRLFFFSDFQTNPTRYVAGELPRLPFADGEFAPNTRVLPSFRVSGPFRLQVPPRFDFGNHACNTIRSAHLPDCDLRSTAKRIHSNAEIRSIAEGF